MTYEGELYLEGHNGTFTSMAEHKFYNRHMEQFLRDTEILYNWAYLTRKGLQTTHDDITEMWKLFLIDQFHDVLPGTCTKMTVDDTRKNFKELKQKCTKICEEAISALLNLKPHLNLKFRRITGMDFPRNENMVIFNSSTFDRKNENGNLLEIKQMSFGQILCNQKSKSKNKVGHLIMDNGWVRVENEFYVAQVCQNGQIVSLKDKQGRSGFEREVVQDSEN